MTVDFARGFLFRRTGPEPVLVLINPPGLLLNGLKRRFIELIRAKE